MPNALLPVPHFEQSRDGMCLPACVRMILQYWGYQASETEIARHVETKSFGTAITNVIRIRRLGYQVNFGSLTQVQLETYLISGKPVIARVWADMLDYWDAATSHVVVVVGFDDKYIYLNDPAFAEAPRRVLWDGFLAAWAEFDETAAAIYP